MILFLHGPDSYRSKEKLNEIVAHYKELKKSSLNLICLDAAAADFSELRATVNTVSMFAETKLVIVKNLFANKKFQEDFLEELKKLQTSKDVIVIYESEASDQRLKLFKTLTKECKCQEFALLDGRELKTWAQQEFASRQATINNDALDLLASYVGNNLWQFSSEIKKLADFKASKTINKQDVAMLVKPNIETDIFATIDALAQKNKIQAIALLHKHLDEGQAPLYLLSMITYQFRNLLTVKQLAEQGMMYASIVKKSGLHPFVVKKTYFQCRQFSFEELKHIYRNIFRVDADIKIGNVEAETALDLLVSKI